MTRHEFRRIAGRRILRLDGATGTELAKRGLPPGVSPEAWCLENPEAILAVQRAYVEAGSDILYAPTFGANPRKLAEFGLEARTEEMNRALAALSRKASPGGIVFGDLAPTGMLVEPFGPLPFEEAVEIYRRQIAALIDGGVDGIAIETMMCLQEARAALIALRELAPDLPALVTLTVEAGGRTLAGDDPLAALAALTALGADAFGCNCSTGPVEMAEVIRSLRPYATIPLVAKPNAGMPRLVDDRTVFDLGAEEFAADALKLADAGAALIGGCCGTTPEHIAALNAALGTRTPESSSRPLRALIGSHARARLISPAAPFTLIGERINPTGKKALQTELRAGSLALVKRFASEQETAGASMLDLNFGLGGIDEAALMRRAVGEVTLTSDLPFSIDTVNPAAAEAALRLYPGRALFNSISAESDRLENLLPVVMKYGAAPILLPLSDAGIPDDASGRFSVLMKLLERLAEYGCPPEECVIDLLVMTVSASPEAPKAALEFLEKCRTEKLNTVCGLSNVSFGLPMRPAVNAAFLGMAAGRGLNLAIANPSAPGIGDFAAASDVLLGKDPKLANFLALAASRAPAPAASSSAVPAAAPGDPREELRDAVIRGQREHTLEVLKKLLDAGAAPGELVDGVLIPAITAVGEKFERKEYYLPQLMQSADAMSSAMAELEPRLLAEAAGHEDGPLFIIATVEGDIHDIGKNIFALLLKNHHFRVLDLGCNVPARAIVDAAKREGASFIGLSALMTTTMPRMKETIELVAAEGLKIPVFVGGAAVDSCYAEAIGAYYGADAMASVRLAQKLAAEAGQ